jgi:hypothetical protein
MLFNRGGLNQTIGVDLIHEVNEETAKGRDVATLMGISPQRVSALAS